VVRGLNFVRSELNGRDTFSANNGRALSFADVPSELMGGVDVFKSPSADMIEGGISGTVNLRTRLPFDSKKRMLSLSAEDSYGDFVKKWSPTYSLLYSDTWDTAAGEFGLLASLSDSKLWTRADGTQVSNFGCRTNLGAGVSDCGNGTKGVWFPRGAAFRSTTTDRERKGQAAAVQWRSNDHTMQATAQYMRSDSNQKWTEHAMEIATDNVTSNGDSRPVAGTTSRSTTRASSPTAWSPATPAGAATRTARSRARRPTACSRTTSVATSTRPISPPTTARTSSGRPTSTGASMSTTSTSRPR
jgi:TonB-dependent receptor